MLNFCTKYKSEGSTNHLFREEACFDAIFRSAHQNGVIQTNTYTIRLYKFGDKLLANKQNNACLTDKAGIIKHLRILKSLFKFKYKIIEKENYFDLVIILSGHLIYHKYLLTWVRYLYEYPFNVFLMDANKLSKLPEFKFESIINLFNLIGVTSGIRDNGVSIHSIVDTSYPQQLQTIKALQDKLKEKVGEEEWLNDLFDTQLEIANELLTLPVSSKMKHSSDYWNSENQFEARLIIYKKNYKILKQKKMNVIIYNNNLKQFGV